MAGNQFDDALDEITDEQDQAPQAGASANDPFTAALNDVVEQSTRARAAKITVAGDKSEEIDPNRAADIYTLARRYGLPSDHVERNFDKIQKRAKRDDTPYARMLRETPALADYVSDPIQAAAVKDDLDPLAALETTARVAGNSIRALAAGLHDFNVGFWGVGEQVGELIGNDALTKFSRYARQENILTGNIARGAQTGAGELEKAFYSGFESLGMMVPGTLASLATGTPAPMLAVMGGVTEGEAYGRARDAGKTVGRSTVFGLTQGAIEVATELIPAKLFLGDLAKNSGFLKMVMHQIASEVPGEQVATLLQDADEWATFNPDKPWSEFLETRPDAAMRTLVATITSVGAMSTVASIGSRMAGDTGKIERAEGSKQFFDSIAESVGAMKSAEKHPASIETVIAQATAGGPIEKLYAPVDTFTTYWQSVGEDPAAMAAELTGDPKAYARALQTGEDLAIPTGTYASKVAGTEHNAFFKEELKVGPNEWNVREATQFKEAQAAATRAEGEAAQAAADETAASRIMAGLQQQLETAGVEKETAAQYTALVGSTFSNIAEIATNPEAIFGKMGLAVERPELGTPAPAVPPAAAPASPQVEAAALPQQAVEAAPAPVAEAPATEGDPYAAERDVLEEFPALDVKTQGPRALISAYLKSVYGEKLPGLAQWADELLRSTAGKNKTKGDQKRSLLAWMRKDQIRQMKHEEDLNKDRRAGVRPLDATIVDTATDPKFKAARRFAGLLDNKGEPAQTIEILDEDTDVNASGESAASAEALSRQSGMKARGESFVVYDRAGNARPLIGPEAVDYQARAGETYGVQGPEGFRALDDKGGKVPHASTGSETSRGIDQGGSPAENRITASRPGTGAKASERAATHLEAVFGSVLDAARQLDPLVDEARLRQEFDYRVDLLLDQQQLAADAGQSPHAILRAIRKLGGITLDENADRAAEIRQMLGGKIPSFGAVAGVPGVFTKKTIATTANKKTRGHGVDVMLQMLQEEPGFEWLESVDMMLDQIDEAMRHGADRVEAGELPGTEELRDVGIRREQAWWSDSWAAADLMEDVDESVIELDAGDTSFDVREFSQSLFDEFEALQEPGAKETIADTIAEPPAVDILDTGEAQGRLPEAGQVRDQEVKTPEFEAPFSLTAPVAKPPKKNAGQRTLFQDEGVTRESVRAWADETKALAGEDVKDFTVNLTQLGDLSLDSLIIDRGAQRAGLGTKMMKELTRFADANGLRVVLSPGQRDPVHGTTSRARLVRFYKQFGFVENKGRHKDWRISAGMLREPNVPTIAAGVKPTETPAFKAWFGESKVVDADGDPLRVYHGTTGTFESFDRDRANIESDFGAGIYFSSNPRDVGENYAGMGPDLTARVERRVEQIQDRYADNDSRPDDELGPTVERVTELLADRGLTLETATEDDRAAAFKAIAKEELDVEHGGLTMPVYLKMENPAIVGGADETQLTIEREYAPLDDFQDDDIERLRDKGYDDDEIRRELSDDNGYTTETGTLPKFLKGLRSINNRYDSSLDIDEAVADIMDAAGYESIGLSQAIEILRKSEGLMYATDEQGDHASSEIIRQAIEAAGFDGIIDNTVDVKFGSQRRLGKSMAGMDADTVHYIVFKPEQIKSAIGNRGTFDPSKKSILYQDEQTPDGKARRGAIRFGADRQFTISLLQKADLSTFLHESGHLFLEVFGDLADQLRAANPNELNARQVKALADYDALLKWLGVETREQIADEHHEKFARGFERYLMEGKAPSQELRLAFARFRSWLVGIYRSLKGLRVELTDDVRRIMDRMVASEEAIAAAEAEAGVFPMFTTAESAGYSPEEFANYRKEVAAASVTARENLETRMLAEVAREQKAAWKAQRAELNDQVRVETYEMPVYQAISAMQRGTKPNGGTLVEGEMPVPLKLSRKMIVDRYGADRLKRLPRFPYIYTKEGGLDPDVVAGMFGYSSGDELLKVVAAAEPMERRIERETDRRMLEEHGSMLLDGTLQERATAAIANEHREAIVRAELGALARLRRQVSPFVRQASAAVAAEKQTEIDQLTGQVRELKAKARGGPARIAAAVPPANVIHEAAQLAVAGMKVGEVKPAVYWRAALRASMKATEAAARQDFDTAIAEKQHELMSLAVYRESTRVLDEIETRVQAAKDLGKPKAQARLGKAGESYLEQVNAILDRYDFARQTGKVLDRRESLRVWVDAMKAQDIPIEIPDDVIDDARRLHYSQLTVEELMGITDALKHIQHLSTLKDKLLKNQDQRDYEIVRDNLVSSIREHNKENPIPIAFRKPERVKRKIKEAFASHARIATIAQLMDGRDDGGAMWSAIIRPVNEAQSQKQARQAEASKEFYAILEKHYPGREMNRLHDKLHIPAIGNSLTLDERLAVAKNWGNETSRDRMLNDPRRAWNREQIQAILDTLDANDLAFVQATFDYLNKFWPEIAAKQKRVTGLEPEKVEALEIVAKAGTIPGGYFPLVADSRYNARTRQWEKLAEADLKRTSAYVSTTTKRGHVETRKKHARYTVKLEGGVVFSHIEQVLHDLTHHEMLIDVNRLLRDPKVSDAFYDTVGDVTYEQFTSAMESIAAGRLEGPRNFIDEAAQFMKSRTQLALLGWNLWTGLQQPLGLFNGADRVGARWVAKGLFTWLTSPARFEHTLDWIHSVSPFMAGRAGSATQDLNDLRKVFNEPGGWFDTMIRTVTADKLTQQTILNSMLWHIGIMQRVADVPTWLGQYEKSKAAGEPDARAYALADQAVIDAQGSGRISDLAKVQRGGPVAQLYMTFYSYGSTTFNATYRRAGRTDFKSPKQVAQFLGGISLIYVFPALGTVILNHVARGAGDDDDDWADYLEEVGRESAASALNGVVIFREFVGKIAKEPRGYAGPAGARLLQMMNTLLDQAKQGELDEAAMKAFLDVGGTIAGFPTAQVRRSIDGWQAIQEKDAPLSSVLFGPPKK